MTADFIKQEIKSLGQIRDEYLKRMTKQEVSFKYDWRFCPDCYYFFLPDHTDKDCEKLHRMETPVVWLNDRPFIFDHSFPEALKQVESVLDESDQYASAIFIEPYTGRRKKIKKESQT